MRLSQFYMPTLKETPSEAQIVSHRLMLRAGFIKQSAAGIYSWLPLGLRVLRKIETIIREEQNKAGAVEVLMPTIQSADLWRESGRYDDYGQEMLRIKDRHDRDILYGPTNEEMVTDIIRQTVRSYKDLPKTLYHIQWKFRDEIRPRFGVMRGREFMMKDAYSFDINADAARHSYNKMFVAYLRTFARMGLTAIPMQADTGPIGGDMSHEFLILADTGESGVFLDAAFHNLDWNNNNVDFNDANAVADIVKNFTTLYAATDEKHDETRFNALPTERQVTGRGIEVGHIFYFGDKYSKPMNASFVDTDGTSKFIEMGSYGIGVSRLVAAAIEASHDDKGIIWHPAIAPFTVGLVNLKQGDEIVDSACESVYEQLNNAGIEVLYHDKNERAGVKFAEMELIGLPYQVIIGAKGAAAGLAEIKDRKTGQVEEISLDSTLARFCRIV